MGLPLCRCCSGGCSAAADRRLAGGPGGT